MEIRNQKSEILNIRRGFTLIELLVVVAIIGILASLAMVSYTGTQKQARDSQRKSDLAQYRNALENFASVNSSLYPIYSDPKDAPTVCEILLGQFMSACPSEPIPGRSEYQYWNNSDGTEYIVWADLEADLGTDSFWVFCSDGRSGKHADPTVAGGGCPL